MHAGKLPYNIIYQLNLLFSEHLQPLPNGLGDAADMNTQSLLLPPS